MSGPTHLEEAISAWHDELTPELAAESSGWLTEQLQRRGLFFGDRPLCTVLRPRFLTIEQYDLLRSRIGVLLQAFDKALSAALFDTSLLDQFRLADWERTLALEEPRIPASPVSRLDAFFDPDDGRLRFTEYNAETPAGSAYNDALTELFLAIPAARRFLSRFALRPLPAAPNVLQALLSAYEQWSGSRQKPVIGILDWKEVPTQSEFVLYQKYFASMGLTCVIADVRDCELIDGRLVAAGTPIDLIYKRVLIHELIERGGLDHPIVLAARTGAVCMVNPFRCKVLHKKASLAVLSDERNAGLFDKAERRTIAEHIPWTRVVEERTTRFHGETVDLLPWMEVNRERLVLKPNDDYGGAGIVLGWEVDGAAWTAAVKNAVATPFIVQERIGLPSEIFPSYESGQLQFAGRIVDTAPFVFGGVYADGCLSRISTATLVNVTAGGGSTVPTFVVEKR
jgi:uncharacterized circularly permuted ATP-grasp superfamily protein